MKLVVATAVAVLLGCTACTASTHRDAGRTSNHGAGTTFTPPRAGVRTAGGPGTGTNAAPAGSGRPSAFCDLARTVGTENLGVSTGTRAPDSAALLRQVDRLDAIAPADLKTDFDVFTRFEHAVLAPGAAHAAVGGDTTSALEHVSRYFTGVCGIT